VSKPVYAKRAYPLCAMHRSQVSIKRESGETFDAREGEYSCAYVVGWANNGPQYCGGPAKYVIA